MTVWDDDDTSNIIGRRIEVYIKVKIMFSLYSRYLHGDVLQRAVRQIRHETDVRVLPQLGARVGLPEEGHLGRNQTLLC